MFSKEQIFKHLIFIPVLSLIVASVYGQTTRLKDIKDTTAIAGTLNTRNQVGLAGEDKNADIRSTQSSRSITSDAFRIPLPVSSEPFDYASFRSDHYNLDVARTSSPIKLDGVLNEEAWHFAPVAKDFFQLEPVEGKPASQPTEVRVLYDDENLYIGFICFDSEPGAIMAPDMRRDTRLSFSNDMVVVALSPLDGHREAYEFQTNPNGARSDAFVSKEGNSNDQDWNGYWNVASSRNASGWSAEFVIPFHVLRFPSRPVQNWAINFGRRIQRMREESYWVPLSRSDGRQALYRFGKGGRLSGLANIKPGGKIQAVPFSVLGGQGSRFNLATPTPAKPIAQTGFNNNLQRQLGGDLKWSITSGFTLNATVNPDFAQVEADDQIVNLSRFEFQFNEKRPFFLERNDIFSLDQGGGGGPGGGGRGGNDNPQLFFSRRIGRQLPDGSSVPIDLGMRVTGKTGRTTFGFLNVQTRETDYRSRGVAKTEPITNWQALRVSQDIGARSSIGLLATFKEPNPELNDKAAIAIPRYARNKFNRVVGFDGNLAFRKSQHALQVMYAKSWTDTLKSSGDEYMWRVQERWQNRSFSYGISYLEIGKNFIAQSGFVTRTNARRAGLGMNYSPFIRKYGIRRITASFRSNYFTRIDTPLDSPESWMVNPNLFFEFERGLWISANWSRNFDTLTGTTNAQIASVYFTPGSYTYDQWSLFFFTDRGKKLSAEGNFRYGKFYSADLMSLSGELSFKPNPRIAMEPGITWNQIERKDRIGLTADQSDYNSRIIPRIRANYSFTPNLSFTSFVQLNNDKKQPQDGLHLNTVTMNFLLAYRSPYGHSFFVAFNQFHDDDLDTDGSYDPFRRTPLRLRDRQIVAKVSYLFNL